MLKGVRITLHAKYLDLLAEKYDCEEKVVTEIINLEAILDLPKGTEHFVSDSMESFMPFNMCSETVQVKSKRRFMIFSKAR